MKVKVGQCWHMHKSLLPQSTVAICEQQLRSTLSVVSWGIGEKSSNFSDNPYKPQKQTQHRTKHDLSASQNQKSIHGCILGQVTGFLQLCRDAEYDEFHLMT